LGASPGHSGAGRPWWCPRRPQPSPRLGRLHGRSTTLSQLAGQMLSLACQASDNRPGEVQPMSARVRVRRSAPLVA
jgi:hypothetical protein